MESNDDVDLDKLIQEELDALNLDDPIEENLDEKYTDDDDHNDDYDEELLRTQRNLERQMQERLLAFESEVKTNLDRYEIDYTEIDQLLQKPIKTSDDEIQTNVARECGIEREQLDQILRSINTEEPAVNSSIDSQLSEDKNQKIEIVEHNLSTIGTNESSESTPRIKKYDDEKGEEEEDWNKKLYDERLAESHRRMLDELALLEQRRKEEEERYAAVLQEQQTRLAEEYRRLQETLDENARQTQNERLQFETLCREQERVTHERHNKMATLIQAWYRGRCVYRQYHNEIMKRATPTLKAIAKKRKKKEQEEAAKLTQIQENDHQQVEVNPTPVLSINHLPSKEPKVKPKQFELVQSTPEKKKKPKQRSTMMSNLPTTQIVQMESPADFVPTIVPQQKKIATPRLTPIERILSPVQNKEQRPISANKNSTPEPSNIIYMRSTTPINRESYSASIPQSNTFEKTIDTTPVKKTIQRSGTFETEPENISPSSIVNRRDSISSTSMIVRSDTFVNQPVISSPPPPPLPLPPMEPISTFIEHRSNTFISKSQTPPPMEIIPPTKSIDSDSIYSKDLPSVNTLPETNISPTPRVTLLSTKPTDPEDLPSINTLLETNISPTPRVTIPHKVSIEGKHPVKAIYSFLNEARRWAEQNRDTTYSNLMLGTEEILQQIPTRKPPGTLRKIPDIDSQILIKASKSELPREIRFLLLEQLLTPCSLSLLGNTFPNLTHLTLRQCKLVQLVGLESCSSLMILDIEGNWLEQIHLQLNQLQYLNVSRNRLTSLLSINTPRLKYLDVSKNRLTRLNGLETLTNLNILLATSNQLLTTIGLQGCTHLLHIDVSDNHLVEMEQLDQCPLLITMKATSNALIQIPCLYNAILLNELDLSANSLTSFDDLSLGSWLPFLTHLRLANNSLQELSMIKLPALIELDLAFNQISDISTVKRLMKISPLLSRINLEQNPVMHDMTESLEMKNNSSKTVLTLLPQSSSTGQTMESIELYLNFLSTITSLLVTLRQTIEQHQIEPFDLMEKIHYHCQQYYEQKIIEPIPMETTTKILSPEEQNIIRLQAHWRRRLIERKLSKQQYAARTIQARWRGYATRQRMRTVRRLHREQYQTYEEIDLSQFDFDEAAFDARFQRPRTPKKYIRQVWQPPPLHIPVKSTPITELAHNYSPRSSSAASSHAKPLVEPLAMPNRTTTIAQEWGFTPSSTTAALMLKRAEKMKWNAERKHRREHLDPFQRLQMARNNELPPGSLRLARRQQQQQQPLMAPTTKQVINTKHLSPPATAQSRSNRVFEWVHTQVARFDDSSVRDINSPRNERKRLPSLDGSADSDSRMRSNETQQQRWPTSSVSIRQPPSLLPPINGQFPRV